MLDEVTKEISIKAGRENQQRAIHPEEISPVGFMYHLLLLGVVVAGPG